MTQTDCNRRPRNAVKGDPTATPRTADSNSSLLLDLYLTVTSEYNQIPVVLKEASVQSERVIGKSCGGRV